MVDHSYVGKLFRVVQDGVQIPRNELYSGWGIANKNDILFVVDYVERSGQYNTNFMILLHHSEGLLRLFTLKDGSLPTQGWKDALEELT